MFDSKLATVKHMVSTNLYGKKPATVRHMYKSISMVMCDSEPTTVKHMASINLYGTKPATPMVLLKPATVKHVPINLYGCVWLKVHHTVSINLYDRKPATVKHMASIDLHGAIQYATLDMKHHYGRWCLSANLAARHLWS